MGQYWEGPSLRQVDSMRDVHQNPFLRQRAPRKYRHRVRPILPRRIRIIWRLIKFNLSHIIFLARYAAHGCLLILSLVTGVIHAFDLSAIPWVDYFSPEVSAAHVISNESIWQSSGEQNLFYLTWNTPPLTSTSEERAVARLKPILYEVRAGDNPEIIAQRFGLQPRTVIWANTEVEENPELLALGQLLTLPPLDGIIHIARQGDTIELIAQSYHVQPAALINFAGNHLSETTHIDAGQTIIVPGGIKVEPSLAPIVVAPTPHLALTTEATSTPSSVPPSEAPTEAPSKTLSVVRPSATTISATATLIPPTATLLPPTATVLPPTQTQSATRTAVATASLAPSPSSTSIPPTWTAIPPTWTAIPPTWTAIPPTWTAIPPTWTAIPPTWTAIPPTWTAIPPTWTAIPPTWTAIPPTWTPFPTLPPPPTALPVASRASSSCCLWPLQGRITTQPSDWHMAIDILAPQGAPIQASGSGQVVRAGWDDTGYGYVVVIDHGSGLSTLYAHLSSYPVTVGDSVAQGQMIANVGATGRATAPHLHFEVRLNNNRQNPYNWLP